MKKTLIAITLLLGSSLLIGQTPQEIVGRVVTAMGGPEAIQKWKTYEAEGDFIYSTPGMDLRGKFRMVQSGPRSWRRIVFTMSGNTYLMLEGYDGKVAWSERMGQVSDQPALNHETESRHDIFLLLQKDVTWSLGKESEIDGRKVISLEADQKGQKTLFWIDPANWLVQEISYRDRFISENEIQEDLDMRNLFSDYRKIEGILFPMKRQAFRKGQKLPESQIATISFSPKVEPSLFARPQAKAELRTWDEMMD